MNQEIKALILAGQVNEIKKILFDIDFEYLKECAETFEKQASFQDAAAVLDPTWRETKSKVLDVQAKALRCIYEFNDLLKECQEAKDKDAEMAKQQQEVQKLFW